MNNQYLTKSNMIVSSIIFAIFSYFYYQYSQKNIEHLEQAQLDKELEPPRITSKHIDKYIQKEFSKVIQIFAKEVKNTAKSMSDFNNDFLLKSDYLNFRNSLFTKDIEKQLILVDSRSVDHDKYHNTSDYKICLTGNDNESCNPTGGFGVFKNVIGFRLVKAVIPASSFVVNDHNNTLLLTYNTSANPAVNIMEKIILDKGSYTGANLAEHLLRKLNYSNITDANLDPADKFIVIFIDSTKHIIINGDRASIMAIFATADVADIKGKLDVTFVDSRNYIPNRFLIIHVNNFPFTINTTNNVIDNKSAYRLFGFSKNQKNISTSSYFDGANNQRQFLLSDHNADHSNHFVDIVVNEIPYIACKKNPRGKMVVDRIPITSRGGSMVEYQSPTSEYFSQNYFYPISLHNLSIQIFQDSSEHLYDTSNLDNYFEFEITMMKNTKNFNRVISKQS